MKRSLLPACLLLVVAACTKDTMSGSGLRPVISQPEAALYIQLPMFDTTVAVHSTENVA